MHTYNYILNTDHVSCVCVSVSMIRWWINLVCVSSHILILVKCTCVSVYIKMINTFSYDSSRTKSYELATHKIEPTLLHIVIIHVRATKLKWLVFWRARDCSENIKQWYYVNTFWLTTTVRYYERSKVRFHSSAKRQISNTSPLHQIKFHNP